MALASMDNLAAHKVAGIREAIEARGAELRYLPPSGSARSPGGMSAQLTGSPDFNPIEQTFAKLKALLRKAAARSAETICVIIGEILRAFTPADAPTISETHAMPNPKSIMV